MSQRTIESIQVLRGLAALLVVVFHLEIVLGKYGAGPYTFGAPLSHAYSGVDLFFVLSGFVMTTIAAGSYSSMAVAGRFLFRRAWRILPLYWLYTTLVVAIMLLAPGLANSSSPGQSILASYLLWPQQQLPVLTVGWTLIHEAFFYIVMALAIAFARERQLPWVLLAWAALTVAAQQWPAASSTPWAAVLSSPLSLEFIAGAAVGLYWRHLPSIFGLPLIVAGAGGFAGSLIWLHSTPLEALPGINRVLHFGLPAALLVLGAVAWESSTSPRIPSVLQRIGDSSYSLYLSHVFVISLAGRLWLASGWNHSAMQYLAFALATMVTCVLVGWLSWRWLELPLQSLLRRPRTRTALQPV